MSTLRRFLVVPEEGMSSPTVSSAVDDDGNRAESGIGISQPEPASADRSEGDIRPTLEGEPERHFESSMRVVSPGVVEDARFVWEGPGGKAKLRQSPHVIHNAPALIDRSTTRYIVRPKLLPLISGDLMCVWIEGDWTPLYQDLADELTVDRQVVKYAICSAETGLWSEAVEITAVTDLLGEDGDSRLIPTWDGAALANGLDPTIISGVDLVQMPDTGEILLHVLVQSESVVTTTVDSDPKLTQIRRLSIFSSTTDGSLWVERSRSNFNGHHPEIDLTKPTGSYDTTPLNAIAVERLPSGRLVAMVVTEEHCWSLVSDDRGATWSPHWAMSTDGNALQGHGVGSTLARNGIAMFVLGFRKSSTFPSAGEESDDWGTHLTMTADGETYSARQYVATGLQTVDPSICVGPDGWPHVYGSAHAFNERRVADQYGDKPAARQFRGAPGELVAGLGGHANLDVEIGAGASEDVQIYGSDVATGDAGLFDLDDATALFASNGGRFTFAGYAQVAGRYAGWNLVITAGTGITQFYRITGYSPAGYFTLNKDWDAGGYVWPADDSVMSLSPPNEAGAGWSRVRFLHDQEGTSYSYDNWRLMIVEGTGAGQIHHVSSSDVENVTAFTSPSPVAAGDMTAPFTIFNGTATEWQAVSEGLEGDRLEDLGNVVLAEFGDVFVPEVQANDGDSALITAINQLTERTKISASINGDGHLVLISQTKSRITLIDNGGNGLELAGDWSGTEQTSGEGVVQASIHILDTQVTPDGTSGYVLFDWDEKFDDATDVEFVITSADTAILRHDTALPTLDYANWELSIVTGPGAGESYQIASSRVVLAGDFLPGGALEDFTNGDKTGLNTVMRVARDNLLMIDISPAVWSDDLTGGDLANAIIKPWGLFPARKASFRLSDNRQGYRDWLWGRRLTSRDPNLAWSSPSEFMPVPSLEWDGTTHDELSDEDQAKHAPFAFHIPAHTRLRNGALATAAPAGDYSAEEWGRVAHNGFVGIDSVSWRGRVILASVFQQDSEGAPIAETYQNTVTSTAAGEVETVHVAIGETVSEGSSVITLVGGAVVSVPAGKDGEVVGISVQEGDTIGIGDLVITTLSYQPSDRRPALSFSSLMAYQLNGWQSLHERLPDSSPPTAYGRPVRFPAFPSGGRVYNHTWDCYGLPDSVGWSVSGAGGTIQTDDDGRLRITGINASYYELDLDKTRNLAGDEVYQKGSRDFCVRFVFRLGIGPAPDAVSKIPVGVAVRNTVFDGAALENEGAFVGIRVGGNEGNENGLDFALIDVDNVEEWAGVSGFGDAGLWTEVLFAGHQSSDGASTVVSCFARQWSDSGDPDFVSDWTDVLDGISTLDRRFANDVVGAPLCRFGNLDHPPSPLTSTSYWKSVQIARGWSIEHPQILEQTESSDPDEETSANLSVVGNGESLIDSGIDNYMRASRTTYSPAHFLRDDVRARWRGQAVTPGGFSLGVGHRFGAENVMSLPTLRQWRSPVIDNSEPSRFHLLYDSGDVGFRPEAIAMFGRNFPSCRIGFGNDTDADDILIHLVSHGVSYGGTNLTRTTAYWSFAAAGLSLITNTLWHLEVDGNRLTVFEDGSPRSIWVPHQFSSQATGRSFYIAFVRDSEAPYDNTPAPFADDAEGPYTSVFKILDNTESTLILDGQPGTAYRIGGEDRSFQIFSDCQVVECAEAFAGVDPEVSYRYMKLTIGRAQMNSDDGQFRLGHLMLGRVFDLDDPHPEWGWSLSYASGVDVADRPDGARFANRKGPMSRELSMGFAVLRPPNGTIDRLFSRGRRGHKDWTSLIRRLEVDKTPVVVAFDPNEPGSYSGSSVSGPEGMMLARVTDPGTVEHVAYDCAESIARYVARIRGIVLREEF